MAKRPNVLFLMSDEHRPDVTGYEGNAVIRTPVLDELAASGCVFRNAYTPAPICIPGRQCLMAGQLPRTVGCEVFGEDLPPGHMTFARRFAQWGYMTAVGGKLHHLGVDQLQGWTRRIAGDVTLGPQYVRDREEQEFVQHVHPTSRVKWSDTKEIQRAGIGRGPHVIDDAFTVQGIHNFIEEYFNSPAYDREQAARPLFLKVSLVQPHYPYTADAAKFRYYLNRVQPFLDQEVSPHPFLSRRQVRPGIDASEREILRATAAYYAMIETIDEHYGTVLNVLRQVGEDLDDWIIVYTSDHGEMLGEHGIWEKQKFFEASVRVPLLIRWPRRFPQRQIVQENVSLCDLFATLCDLADLPTPPGLDSRSLVPLLDGERTAWTDEAVSQFGRHNLMIKRGTLKYQYYGAEMPDVLFDLARNPSESRDFIDDPAYASAVAAFRARLGELGHGPDADRTYVNAGYARAAL